MIKKLFKKKREYNSWVANETLEDYSLRYTAKSYRKWPELLIANTAIGGISFLALEAIGASLIINYGFSNAVWAILAVCVVVFLTSFPISYYSAKYNVDMDLLTRGAGFGYIGSTITSLIYASFCFIFFALEGAIMAQALLLYFGLPLFIGYVFCSLIIIPIVIYGVTLINKLQFWTQPVWIVLMVLPFIFVIIKDPQSLTYWTQFSGRSASGAEFSPLLFGAAATVAFSLIVQVGEQVDYLRFLPDKTSENRFKWWTSLIIAGPGWIFIGGLKLLGGAFLATLAVSKGVSFYESIEPVQMYLEGFKYVFSNFSVVLLVTTLFILISQIKINVTNAYAGSLAWSNFFSRMTHNHPGRVVWLVFNVLIGLLLMELGVFHALEIVLGIYSNVAIAWIGAIVSDLVILKPLGISPSYIEFKRGHLYNINPVGLISMSFAATISIVAYFGYCGETLQAFSSFMALGVAFIMAPIIAYITKGKYYIARSSSELDFPPNDEPQTCSFCDHTYEKPDLLICPVYEDTICSLCCGLESQCNDGCKDDEFDWSWAYSYLEKFNFLQNLNKEIVKLILILIPIACVVSGFFGLYYYQTALTHPDQIFLLQSLFLKLFFITILIIGAGVFWFLLSTESMELAEKDLETYNKNLQKEVTDRIKVEQELRASQDMLLHAEKLISLGRLTGYISHEFNNPLQGLRNIIDILSDSDISEKEKKLAKIGKAECDRMAKMIRGLRDFYKPTSGKVSSININQCLEEVFALQFKSLKERCIQVDQQFSSQVINVDVVEDQIKQVLLNIIQNAADSISGEGQISLTTEKHDSNVIIKIQDTGSGISKDDKEKLFEPFFTTKNDEQGTGLGLSISYGIIQDHGGTIEVESALGIGTTFVLSLPIKAQHMNI
jgi:signal transduction histidine kinase